MKDFFHNIQLRLNFFFSIFYVSNFAEWFFYCGVQQRLYVQ